MVNHYLIEFRVQGYAKRYAKEVMDDIRRRFGVRNAFSGGGVPHITMYGPFTTHNEHQMVSTVVHVCRGYQIVPFKFRGFNFFDNPNHKVIFLDVAPSKELKRLRHHLAESLRPITATKSSEDKKNEDRFYFHSTIAFKNINHLFPQIWSFVKSKQHPDINQVLLRVTILRNGRILNEYDLYQRRLLNRREALDPRVFAETIRIMKSKHIDYDDVGTQRTLENEEPSHHKTETKQHDDKKGKPDGVWRRLLRWAGLK